MTISRDLSWDAHIEATYTKASQRLYVLRLLRRAGNGVDLARIVHIDTSVIRPVLYRICLPCLACTQDCLEHYLRNWSQCSRRLCGLLPDSSYREALQSSGLRALHDRREELSRRFFQATCHRHTNCTTYTPRSEGGLL